MISQCCCTISHCFVASFDGEVAKKWSNANYALAQSVEIFEFIREQVDYAKFACTTAISMVPGSSVPCTGPAVVVGKTMLYAICTVKQLISISERTFDEIVGSQDGDYELRGRSTRYIVPEHYH